MSSSSLTVGMSMGSGTRLKASIVPDTSCTTMVIKVKNPKREKIS